MPWSGSPRRSMPTRPVSCPIPVWVRSSELVHRGGDPDEVRSSPARRAEGGPASALVCCGRVGHNSSVARHLVHVPRFLSRLAILAGFRALSGMCPCFRSSVDMGDPRASLRPHPMLAPGGVHPRSRARVRCPPPRSTGGALVGDDPRRLGAPLCGLLPRAAGLRAVAARGGVDVAAGGAAGLGEVEGRDRHGGQTRLRNRRSILWMDGRLHDTMFRSLESES